MFRQCHLQLWNMFAFSFPAMETLVKIGRNTKTAADGGNLNYNHT